MASMARTLGIPARVAVGFTPGSPGSDGRIHVSSHDYHAWVEVPFPGHGWLSFEPTPGRTNPVALPYQSVPAETELPVFCATRGCTQAEIDVRAGATAGGAPPPPAAAVRAPTTST
jgi:transglutaminase-like putative cysteine protease